MSVEDIHDRLRRSWDRGGTGQERGRAGVPLAELATAIGPQTRLVAFSLTRSQDGQTAPRQPTAVTVV